MEKAILSGNEAVARGAYEAGVSVACAYPGTPSTEILETLGKNYPTINSEWSVNEKVSLEVAMGASFAGARALVAMKHVGLNVAADPFFSLAYIGSTGGIVIVSCDDPSMHSSQNEQDNRNYGKSAFVPVLTPSDSQECKDYIKWGIKISEEFDTPVLINMTTRTSHSKSIVELEEISPQADVSYEKDMAKRVILPMNARKLKLKVLDRLEKLKEFAEVFPENKIELNDTAIGVITSGISYQYVKEVLPDASVLKLGLTYPLPERMIKDFVEKCDDIIVIEETDPFIETELKIMGISPKGKSHIPAYYELNPERVRAGINNEIDPEPIEKSDVPKRPPVLCPGCPHSGVFYTLKKMKAIVTGDIGCYTLGALPPLNCMDTCVDMGASIGNALGIEKAYGDNPPENLVAVIGESTFFHSGITGLIDCVYNQGNTNILILDNRITAMTGHQHHPGTGKTLMGDETKSIEIADIAKACQADYVKIVDPYNLQETREAFEEGFASEGVSVIIPRRPCALLVRKEWKEPLVVLEDKCTGCRLCLQLGCPAISFTDDKKAYISKIFCTGCTVCSQICPEDAIVIKDEE